MVLALAGDSTITRDRVMVARREMLARDSRFVERAAGIFVKLPLCWDCQARAWAGGKFQSVAMLLAMSTRSVCVTGFTKYPLTPNPSALARSWAWLEEVRTMTGRVGTRDSFRIQPRISSPERRGSLRSRRRCVGRGCPSLSAYSPAP